MRLLFFGKKEKILRCLANVITILRIICSGVLMLTAPLSAAFYALYTVCGISDIADGAAARLMHTQSRTGALLDSAADLVFAAAVLFKLLPLIPQSRLLWYGILTSLALRCLSYAVGVLKYRRFAALHTVLNKLTGFGLFCAPYLLSMVGSEAVCGVLCVLAVLSSAEELAVTVCSKRFDPDIRGLFSLHH